MIDFEDWKEASGAYPGDFDHNEYQRYLDAQMEQKAEDAYWDRYMAEQRMNRAVEVGVWN